MNAERLNDCWDEIREALRLQWPALTEDELDNVDGSLEKLYGLMREKYGMQARDLDRHLGEISRPSLTDLSI